MRVCALIEALGAGDPGAWVQALAVLITRAHQSDDPGPALAVQCLAHAAADPALPYATRQRLYEAAIERGLPAVARLLLAASPPPRSGPPAQAARQRAQQLAPERALRPTGRPLTLGERKALARTHDREQILLMLRDPHPAVVAILLENPHVTEPDVQKIASARPAVPEALARLAAHPRWSVRHAVKRALVQNPSTPLADAIRIATTLPPGELAELSRDAALPEPLRLHAAQLRAASGEP
ncbi:MAG TPA: hypothetical protein VNO30_18040 [Kofleriaceae bacterium]|nr:hypothetical protein [Kofleriaceae bacterium]